MANPNLKSLAQKVFRSRDEWFVWLLTVELAAHSAVCAPVAHLYQERLAGRPPTAQQWQAVAEAAEEAAEAAAAAEAAEAGWRAEAEAAAEAAAEASKTRQARAYAECLTRNGVDFVQVDLHAKVCDSVQAGAALDMSDWHCGTSHCRAGWALTVAGEVGAELEASVGPELAARAIYMASTGYAPDFFADDATALADIQRCAAEAGVMT